jgi:hypothetical protein
MSYDIEKDFVGGIDPLGKILYETNICLFTGSYFASSRVRTGLKLSGAGAGGGGPGISPGS